MILRKVQSVAPQHKAVLAGGALRDQDNGRPVKDLDIFVPMKSGEEWLELLAGIIEVFGLFPHDLHLNLTEAYLNTVNEEVTGITTFYTWNSADIGPFDLVGSSHEVNLIGLDLEKFSLTSVLDRIDIGFCRIGFDGDHLWKTEEYLQDQREKTMTVLYAPTDAALDRSKRRYNKLFKKYPEWRFVDKSGLPNGWAFPVSA